MMEVIKEKWQLLHEILACSQKQADFLMSEEDVDMEGLDAITDIKQKLIETLSQTEDQTTSSAEPEGAAEERLAEENRQLLQQITEMDAANIKRLESKMQDMQGELKDTREKIKINTAYQPILGREKNQSKRLDIKDI